MKYTILKALDVAGLNVLEPFVRLCYGEEPSVQLKKLGLYVLVPILTFVVFIGAWANVGPRHKTKSGEVPGPGRVVEAWSGIVQFANRENQKGADFKASGKLREASLSVVQEESERVKKYSALSNERFKKLESKKDQALEQKLAPYLKALDLKEKEYAANVEDREAKLLGEG